MASSRTKSRSISKSKSRRDRSLSHTRPFYTAVFFSSQFYLGVLLTIVALLWFLLSPAELTVRLMIAGSVFSIVMWLIASFKRRSALCPLCRGTPLINSGALVHSKAVRIPPLNHGMSAILSIIATQRFRCMYCGSSFDMLKTPSHLRGNDGDGAD